VRKEKNMEIENEELVVWNGRSDNENQDRKIVGKCSCVTFVVLMLYRSLHIRSLVSFRILWM